MLILELMMNATAATFSEVTFARADPISPTAFKSAFRVPRRVAPGSSCISERKVLFIHERSYL